MRDTKFTLNALLLVALIFSVIVFFFTVKLTGLSHRMAVNEYYPIEGTEQLAVRYSSVKGDGVVQGSRNSAVLRLEGTFGHDWGAVFTGDGLFLNEYESTDLGFMLCSVVRVDPVTFEKVRLLRDAVLRGRCASGELVCLAGCLPASDYPATNALCSLYALSDPAVRPEGSSAEVLFLDPATGEILFRLRDEEAQTEVFEERYLLRTLEEVRG